MHEKSEIIASVCELLETDNRENAVDVLRPMAAMNGRSVSKLSKAKEKDCLPASLDDTATPNIVTKRKYTAVESTCLFINDGFVDRYNGERLVFPGVLRLLSDIFPIEFPYHPNWKAGACHPWYWELFPTVDHIIPVTRTGVEKENPANWVTTSMINNLSKSNTTLERLGWKLVPQGSFGEWDGLIRWFLRYTDKNLPILQKSYLRTWRNAAIQAFRKLQL
jgi:hypothetical protein